MGHEDIRFELLKSKVDYFWISIVPLETRIKFNVETLLLGIFIKIVTINYERVD